MKDRFLQLAILIIAANLLVAFLVYDMGASPSTAAKLVAILVAIVATLATDKLAPMEDIIENAVLVVSFVVAVTFHDVSIIGSVAVAGLFVFFSGCVAVINIITAPRSRKNTAFYERRLLRAGLVTAFLSFPWPVGLNTPAEYHTAWVIIVLVGAGFMVLFAWWPGIAAKYEMFRSRT